MPAREAAWSAVSVRAEVSHAFRPLSFVYNWRNNRYNSSGEKDTVDKPFMHFVIDPALLKRIDDFRFKHRFTTRAAAIKWLLAWALKQKPAPEEE